MAPVAMAGGPKKKPNAPKRENLNVAGYELWGDVESVVMTYYYPVDNGEWVDTYSITYTFTENGDVALAVSMSPAICASPAAAKSLKSGVR